MTRQAVNDIPKTIRARRGLAGNEGSILIMAIFMIFAAAAIGSALAVVSSTDLQISGNQQWSTEALYAAEAGLHEAVHRIGLPNPTIETVGGWTGNVSIADNKPYDPNYEARIYMTSPGNAPAGGGSVVTTGTMQDISGDYLQFSEPSGTEGVLTIEHKWQDLNGNGVRETGELVLYDRRRIPQYNFTTGYPVEIVTVTGRAGGNSTRTIQAEIGRITVSVNAPGALYLDNSIRVTGTPDFCGFDHKISIVDETEPNACFSSHQSTGHKAGIATTGDEIERQGNAHDILGQPAPTDTSSLNVWYTLPEILGMTQDEVDDLLSRPHFTSFPGPGTPMDGITHIQGDVTLNSNVVGSGLCYITGDLSINGDFIYRGLVYVEGDIKASGNPWVLGSVCVKGTGDFNTSAGNATILFSTEAVAAYLGQYIPVVQLSWRELR